MLQVREDAVQGVLEEAEAKLQGFSQDQAKYEAMLADLLVQALAKLKQPETKVKSRKCDAELVKVRRSAPLTTPPGVHHHHCFSVLLFCSAACSLHEVSPQTPLPN